MLAHMKNIVNKQIICQKCDLQSLEITYGLSPQKMSSH